jgi:GNAT superfamily N-acetyltransferase
MDIVETQSCNHQAVTGNLLIRPATANDATVILDFIKELARYEEAEHQVTASLADIERDLANEAAPSKALMCMRGDEPVGFALYFFSYSTWLGRQCMYLEDLYVSNQHRGLGAGKALLKHLAELAVDTGCGRLEWSVLDWNTPAIKFYESIGAKAQPEWVRYRLAGDDLLKLAHDMPLDQAKLVPAGALGLKEG